MHKSGISPLFAALLFLVHLLPAVAGNGFSEVQKRRDAAQRAYLRGDFEGAAHHYDQAAAVAFREFGNGSTYLSDILYDRAVVALELGHFQAAQESLRQALRHNPNCVAARVKLADVLSRCGQQAEAERQLYAALSKHPDSAQARLQLAHLYRQNGDVIKASQEYHNASELMLALLSGKRAASKLKVAPPPAVPPPSAAPPPQQPAQIDADEQSPVLAALRGRSRQDQLAKQKADAKAKADAIKKAKEAEEKARELKAKEEAAARSYKAKLQRELERVTAQSRQSARSKAAKRDEQRSTRSAARKSAPTPAMVPDARIAMPAAPVRVNVRPAKGFIPPPPPMVPVFPVPPPMPGMPSGSVQLKTDAKIKVKEPPAKPPETKPASEEKPKAQPAKEEHHPLPAAGGDDDFLLDWGISDRKKK